MTEIRLVKGDITKLSVDAIVNAANSALSGGGGVDGAIHRAGGPSIMEECRQIRQRQGGCAPGQAVITGGGRLPATFVIHTVGPVWRGGDQHEEEVLANAYRNSLLLAEKHVVRSIAFPNISTGVYGFPREPAARIAISAVRGFAYSAITTVVFCCFDDENYNLYSTLLK